MCPATKTRHPDLKISARPSKDERDHVQRLWRQYKRNGDEKVRNRLVEHYLHLVRYHAQRLHAGLPRQVELDDLTSAGFLGLMEAVDGFDLDRGVRFETYCGPRIQGAIRDWLRKTDWAPRLVRDRTGKVAHAVERFAVQRGHAPSDDELMKEMGLAQRQFARIRSDAVTVGVKSLSRQVKGRDAGGRDLCEIDLIEDPGQINPLAALERLSVRESLLRDMSRAERLIVLLYYYEQMTMREIGKTLDLSESRVSQMHSSILARLRAQVSRCGAEAGLDVA